jgi:hypothetical protein
MEESMKKTIAALAGAGALAAIVVGVTPRLKAIVAAQNERGPAFTEAVAQKGDKKVKKAKKMKKVKKVRSPHKRSAV